MRYGGFGQSIRLVSRAKRRVRDQGRENRPPGEAASRSGGKYVAINHFKVPPDFVGGKHYHSGPTYVYILKGTLTIEEEGKPTQNFKAGELYVEPLGTAMQGFNKSADEATEFVVFQVQNEGEPLMYQAE